MRGGRYCICTYAFKKSSLALAGAPDVRLKTFLKNKFFGPRGHSPNVGGTLRSVLFCREQRKSKIIMPKA